MTATKGTTRERIQHLQKRLEGKLPLVRTEDGHRNYLPQGAEIVCFMDMLRAKEEGREYEDAHGYLDIFARALPDSKRGALFELVCSMAREKVGSAS